MKLGVRHLGSDAASSLYQHLAPTDLFLVSHEQQAGNEKALLSLVLGLSPAKVLICPEMWHSPLSRMLVLYRNQERSRHALATAAELCRCFRAKPIVLTVARSEKEARRLQQPARAAIAQYSLSADFDFLIGSEVSAAAACVARWRQCQLVVMGRSLGSHWWPWWRGRTTERLIGLADSLAVLALPCVGEWERERVEAPHGLPEGAPLLSPSARRDGDHARPTLNSASSWLE